ncbi:MAG: tyrosine-type recombinase/integrase [Spirochaetales bacterium]|uniref:Tyrosine-type recombinase/integrase n=1 Tax=Candidatus Thalassospirochaeta sargassi TaxID=3119039 RepID=A0AAJ1MJN4_9SPIO|nr:tyrosine-type recombinase/integrase [Spirochaetales bacterium]
MIIKITEKNRDYLSVSADYNEQIINAIKKIPGRKWLPDDKIWIYPNRDSNTQLFLKEIYNTGLFNYPAKPAWRQGRETPIVQMLRWMKLKNYSAKTITVYQNQIQWFFKRTGLKPEEITTEDITLYIEKMKNLTGCSSAWIAQCISALKCYYNHGLKTIKRNPADKIPLPKKTQNYPDILSRNEVKLIIEKGTMNIKHHFLLSLIYSAGLRVSEAVNLKNTDIDTERMMIHIRNSKGKKSRYVMLSEKAAVIYERYKNRVFLQEWLFPGAKEHTHLSIRTAQVVFKTACSRVDIVKNVSIHSLRHAFATHLLEDGVDLRYIQELLGHKSSKTTEIYTHVTKKDINRIRSPLDSW